MAMPLSAGRPPPQHVCAGVCTRYRWCIASRHAVSLAYLEFLDLSSCQSASVVLDKILDKDGHRAATLWRNRIFLIRKRVISEADLSLVSPSQLEAQRPPYLVHLSNVKRNELLTQALRHPDVLAASTDFVSIHKQYAWRQDRGLASSPQRTLVVGWETDSVALVYVIGFVMLLSVVAGVITGVVAHNASLGIAASGGLAAVLSCAEVFIVWPFR